MHKSKDFVKIMYLTLFAVIILIIPKKYSLNCQCPVILLKVLLKIM